MTALEDSDKGTVALFSRWGTMDSLIINANLLVDTGSYLQLAITAPIKTWFTLLGALMNHLVKTLSIEKYYKSQLLHGHKKLDTST